MTDQHNKSQKDPNTVLIGDDLKIQERNFRGKKVRKRKKADKTVRNLDKKGDKWLIGGYLAIL